METPTVELLTSCGLPEEQAKASIAAIETGCGEPTGTPCFMHYTLKIKDGSSLEDVQIHLEHYAHNAKRVPGALVSHYAIAGNELLFFSIMLGPSVMDAHIGYCFPHYAPMMAHADMQFIRCSCDASQVDWWKQSCSAWGGELVVAPSSGASSVEFLTNCGLPAPQAKASVAACAAARSMEATTGTPCFILCTLKINDGSSLEDVQTNLTHLGQTAKKVPGKLYSDYAVHGDELLFFDVYMDPSAMDAHIGLCFPFFAPITAHTTMQFIRGSCDGNQLDWWKKSCSAWGGEQSRMASSR